MRFAPHNQDRPHGIFYGFQELETYAFLANFKRVNVGWGVAGIMSDLLGGKRNSDDSQQVSCPPKEEFTSSLKSPQDFEKWGTLFFDFGHSLRLAHSSKYTGCWAIVERTSARVKIFIEFPEKSFTSHGNTFLVKVSRNPSWSHTAVHCKRSCGLCDITKLWCTDDAETEGGNWCKSQGGKATCPFSGVDFASKWSPAQKSSALFGRKDSTSKYPTIPH